MFFLRIINFNIYKENSEIDSTKEIAGIETETFKFISKQRPLVTIPTLVISFLLYLASLVVVISLFVTSRSELINH